MDLNKMMSEAWNAHRSGESDRAEQILDGIIRAYPQAVPAIVASGIVAGSRGQSQLAKSRMEAALKLDPKCLPALHWLSMLALEAGLGEDAIVYAEREVRLSPQEATGYADLARGYVAADRYEQASACYRRAIALNPNQPTLYCEHSAVLENLARDGEAAESLRRALQLDPNSSWILRLAEFELRDGRTQEALRLCRHALTLNQDIAETHMILAETLGNLQEDEEAERHWERAAQLEPNKGLVAFKRAESLRLLGRFDEAIGEYRKAVELDPTLGRAYYSLVASKKVTAEEMPLIHAMEIALNAESLADKDRINLLYGLAKSFDNLGDYERAIGYYDQANSINKTQFLRHISFDRDQFKAQIDATIAIFSQRFLKENQSKGLNTELPILVVGMMRSGTTLTEQILSSHRDVGGAGEQIFWPDHEPQIVDSVHCKINFEALHSSATAYVDLLKSLTPGFPRVVDKNPANAFAAGLIHLAHLDARAVLFGDDANALKQCTTNLQSGIAPLYTIRYLEDVASAGAPQLWTPSDSCTVRSAVWDTKSRELTVEAQPITSGLVHFDLCLRKPSPENPNHGPAPALVQINGKPIKASPVIGGYWRVETKVIARTPIRMVVKY